jgi:hypothetical protein
MLREAVHTPAHRTLEVIHGLPPVERRIALGNRHVDGEAKLAREELHPGASHHQVKELNGALARARGVAMAAAAILPLFPKMAFERPPRQQQLRRRRRIDVGWHSWKRFEAVWRCEHCLLAMPPAMHASAFPMNGCLGRPKPLRKPLCRGESLGHQLQMCGIAAG